MDVKTEARLFDGNYGIPQTGTLIKVPRKKNDQETRSLCFGCLRSFGNCCGKRLGAVQQRTSALCNAHWQSDVDAGRIMGSATVARLHADDGFLADLKAAREEVQKALQAQEKPALDCAAEASALAAR